MSLNIPQFNNPMILQSAFIKEMPGSGAAYDSIQSYANIDDIANLRQIGQNHWEAASKSHAKNPNGTETTYHFDNLGAAQIINFLA